MGDVKINCLIKKTSTNLKINQVRKRTYDEISSELSIAPTPIDKHGSSDLKINTPHLGTNDAPEIKHFSMANATKEQCTDKSNSMRQREMPVSARTRQDRPPV
jgi:Uri superfamily endonuclease